MRLFIALAAMVVCACGCASRPKPEPPPMPPGLASFTPSRSSLPKAEVGQPLVVPQFPYQSANWWGQQIASDGSRHALLYSTFAGAYAYIWPPGVAVLLPSWDGFTCPGCVLEGNRLIVSDLANGGVRISTFELGGTNASLIEDLTFGDSLSRCPAMTATPNGGTFTCWYQHDSSYNLCVAYRSNLGMWITNEMVFVPGPIGIPSIALAAVPGPDGRVWVVMNRDSSHTIDLARYDESSIHSFRQALLNADTINGTNVMGEMAPNGEFPNVMAAYDAPNNRVLLEYQNYLQWPSCGNLYSRQVVVSLKDDLIPALVTEQTNGWVNEVFNPSPLWIGPDGFTLLSFELNEPDCTEGPWHTRSFDGRWSEGQSYPGLLANNVAWSADGWAFWRGLDNVPKLQQIELSGPVLSISKQGDNVLISWTHGKAGDVLEVSNDLKHWSVVSGANPASFAIATKLGFFRVRR